MLQWLSNDLSPVATSSSPHVLRSSLGATVAWFVLLQTSSSNVDYFAGLLQGASLGHRLHGSTAGC
eukprot:5100449-Amphidinium_carterae.1